MSELHDKPALARVATEKHVNGQGSLSERVRSLRLKTDGPGARPRSTWLPWGLTLIALATAGVFGWRSYRLSPADIRPSEQETSSGDTKVTAGPSTGSQEKDTTGDVVLDAKGYVIAAHQIQLSPQVGGEIIWLDPNFKEGAVYKKGDILAQIDPVIYAARLKSARAALKVAEVNLREVQTGSALQEIRAARAQLNNMAAKLEQAKIDERTKRMAGIAVARSEMENAIMQVAVDTAGHEAQRENFRKLEVALEERRLVADAQLNKAHADVDEAEKQLKNCTILAPTTGIVLSKKAELGGYVNPLAFGAAGYLCEMADLLDLEAELDIQERDIKSVKPGQRCRIMPEAGQRDEEFLRTHPQGYTGYVSRRMPMANRTKGAITVRVKIEFPQGETSGQILLPDMGALVSFLKEEK